jgi:uroporphyrinogen-III synthase
VREIPCIETRWLLPESVPEPGQAVTFSSRRGVEGMIRSGLTDRLVRPAEAEAPLVAAVGGATAAALRTGGIEPELVADPPRGDVLGQLLLKRLVPGSRVVAVRGNLRVGHMEALLEESGHRVVPVVVYENVEPEIPGYEPFDVAAVFVASPSAARRLIRANPWIAERPFYAVGPTTGAAVRGLGVRESREAGTDFDGWVEALAEAWRNGASGDPGSGGTEKR